MNKYCDNFNIVLVPLFSFNLYRVHKLKLVIESETVSEYGTVNLFLAVLLPRLPELVDEGFYFAVLQEARSVGRHQVVGRIRGNLNLDTRWGEEGKLLN